MMTVAALARPDAPRAQTTRIQHVTDRAGLASLGRDWNALLDASPADSPFLTWEWLDAWTARGVECAVVTDGVKTRQMQGTVTSGDCNSCHTVNGTNGAPGRIMAP